MDRSEGWAGSHPSFYPGMRRYLTNMNRAMIGIVEEALIESGRRDIRIDPDPIPPCQAGYDRRTWDWLRDDHFSIYVDGGDRDCGDFWCAYERLLTDPKWKTYLKLAGIDR